VKEGQKDTVGFGLVFSDLAIYLESLLCYALSTEFHAAHLRALNCKVATRVKEIVYGGGVYSIFARPTRGNRIAHLAAGLLHVASL